MCKVHAVEDAELYLASASYRDLWYRSKNRDLCIEILKGLRLTCMT